MLKKQFVLFLFLAALPLAAVSVKQEAGDVKIVADAYRATITPGGGIIRRVDFGGKKTVFYPSALWRAKLKDGNINSEQAKCTGIRIDGNRVELDYLHDRLKVTVFMRANEDSLDISGRAEPTGNGELLEFAAPACFVFPPLEQGEDVVCQFRGPSTPGFRLNGNFFKQRETWQSEATGDAHFRALFGALPESRSVPYVMGLKPGNDFGKFLSEKAYRDAICFKGHTAIDARPEWPLPAANAGLVLLTNGRNGDPVLTAHRLGGENGALFRMGALIQGGDRVRQLIRLYGAIAREHRAEGRDRICLIDVASVLPDWTSSISNWLYNLGIVGVKPEMIRNGDELFKALNDPRTAAIINPYANNCMGLSENGRELPFDELISQVRKFVRNGGFWFECQGKVSFSAQYRRKPGNLNSGWATVPNSFADFFVFEYDNGKSLAVYSVQPRGWEPFAGAKDPAKLFLPTRFLLLGKPNGNGVLERRFVVYAKAGQPITTPVTRLQVTPDVYAAGKAFRQANGIARTMAERIDPEFLKKFIQLPLITDADVHRTNYAQNREQIKKLPPCIYHLTFYMRGDFDKQYPDLMPPLPRWGTAENFKALAAQIREKGGMFMPYTNPTMWCDAPRGPTFQKAGDAPLQLDLNGHKVRESWGSTTSWATCMWHPAVRAINDEVVRMFTEDYPADIVFQDQVGARSLPTGAAGYDLNPASPAPHARIEGFLSQAQADVKHAVLGTEDFWAMLAGSYLLGQGLNESTVRLTPEKAMMKDRYPADAWEFFPVNALLTHEQSVFFYIRTGLEVPDHQIAWALALGNGMYAEYSYLKSTEADTDRIRYLAELQKAVAARCIGKPLVAFRHKWGENQNDGTIHAQYGPVKIFANFLPEARQYGDALVAPGGGYFAEGGGVKAGLVRKIGNLEGDNAFIATPEAVKLYAKGGEKAVFPCGRKLTSVSCGGSKIPFVQNGNAVQVTLPGSEKSWPFLHEVTLQ